MSSSRIDKFTDFIFLEETEMDNVSLAKLSEIVEVLFTKRAEIDERQKEIDEESARLDRLKEQVIGILDKHNQKEFSHAKYGKVYTQTKYQVTMPRDPDKARQLRAYFAKQGMEDMLTINHMTLNSLYNSIKDEKEARGEEIKLDDIIPGVDEPKARVVLAMKKAAK